jgi:RNA polymerase sigma-70 factor (ECF subfamily)
LTTKSVNIHQEVIDKCRNGDVKAQYELYKLYQKAMYNTAIRICGNEDDAKDVLQESFISAFRNLQQYRADASFGAWLKRIVINYSLNLIKKNNALQESMENTDTEDYYEWEEVPDYSMTVRNIKDAIQSLPEGFRTVITLYLFEGYDHKEIGEILGISESTSKSQYNRAKKKIRTLLNQEVKYG